MVTFFYPPDLCAGSFRAAALVEALRARGGSNISIDVLTTQPNRYQSFSHQAEAEENVAGVRVRRIALPSHRSGFVDQARAFAHYARVALQLVRNEDYDLVIGTSSRLMTAVLAAWLSRRHAALLYLDLRDIFVENMRELLKGWYWRPLLAVFDRLERWAIARAARVNLVSAGFLPYFTPRYLGREFSCFPNGVDRLFSGPVERRDSARTPGEPLRIVYAGNVGEGQGMHLILPALARSLEGRATFRVFGDGGRIEQLRGALDGLDNVELLPPVAREQLLVEYREADVLFLHLNDLQAFRRVLPSKLFEYAATGKPLWAGVAGYAAEFIRREVPNAAVFAPCDVAGALSSLEDLRLDTTSRAEFVDRYARERIMRGMADDILELLERPCH